MATFLLTWNPERKHRWEDLHELLTKKERSWSCGTRKDMAIGSRVFLLKQGPEPRGIVASGRTVSPVYPEPHWQPKRARLGHIANYVDVEFDIVLGPDPTDLLPRSELDRESLKSVYWNTTASGIEVAEPAARALERLWKRFMAGDSGRTIQRDVQAVENTLTEARHYIRKRDRRLRQRALAAAQGVCAGCLTNWGEALNGLGVRVLQVHHRQQLSASDAPRITTLNDLVVVCANCHALIHSNSRHAMAVSKLRRLLKQLK